MTDPSTGAKRDAADECRTPHADLLAGATFVALGAAFAVGGARYEIGSAFRMGPGYVPLVLGGLLVALGLAIVGAGVLARLRPGSAVTEMEALHEEPGPIPWVRGGLLVAAIVLFGLTVRGLGLAGALFLTTFLAALAGHRNGVVRSAVIAAGLTVLCLVVFVALLQLRLPVVGTWLGG